MTSRPVYPACVRFVIGICFCVFGTASLAQGPQNADSWDGVWRHISEPGDDVLGGDPWVRPRHFSAFRADMTVLTATLARAPMERTIDAVEAPLLFSIPMPTGEYQAFELFESPIMEPGLQQKFPEIRTYAGQGIDDPAATVRLDVTPQGFHAQVLSPSGRVMVDPLNRGDRVHYASYYGADSWRDHEWSCEGAFGVVHELPDLPDDDQNTQFGETLREYRLACAATGEYTQFHGGTVALGQAAIVTAMNRVNGVYEREVAIRMNLVANNDQVVFTNGSTDPYSNNNGGAMLSQNISTLNSIIGSSNYDIGHVFSTGGGGVAYLGAVCTGNKAGGVTGLPSPRGDTFYIDYVCHEMGHQFGANHCYNSSTSGCSGQRSGTHAYEPGSASTIMGYAGLCGSDNIQTFSDPYFGSDSFTAIRSFIENGSGRNCDATSNSGNNGPIVDAGPSYSIPVGTPFTLTATGSDPDGDTLTFCWEERDLGPSASLTTPDDGQFPLNRSYEGTESPSRTVPRLQTILANSTDSRDRLPEVGRAYAWRVTARDNRAGGGGIEIDEVTHTVVGSAGPFDVSQPDSSAVWRGSGNVTWNVAGTDASPINCSQVNILLSLDGGETFDVVLASNTPNDGSQTVVIPPNLQSNEARVKVEGVGNIFFDINPDEFVVELTPALVITLPDGPVALVAPGAPTDLAVEITDGSEQIDPGSERLYYSYDGGAFQSVALADNGGGAYIATLPGALCTDEPRYYIEAMGDGGSTVRLPEGAPGEFFSAPVGSLDVLSSEDFESPSGWLVDPAGTDEGAWEVGVPIANGFGDPDGDADGSGNAYVTGNAPFDDVNGGQTVLIAPSVNLEDGGAIGYSYWISSFPGVEFGPGDGLFVDVATDQFSTNWAQVRAYTDEDPSWKTDLIVAGADFETSPTVRVRFRAVDADAEHIVEAGLDAFEVLGVTCDDACVADFNGDGSVNTQDVLAFLNAWSDGDSSADVNDDGSVNTQDVLEFLNLWNAGC